MKIHFCQWNRQTQKICGVLNEKRQAERFVPLSKAWLSERGWFRLEKPNSDLIVEKTIFYYDYLQMPWKGKAACLFLWKEMRSKHFQGECLLLQSIIHVFFQKMTCNFQKRVYITFIFFMGCRRGGMADALRSGRSPLTRVKVQVLSSAPSFSTVLSLPLWIFF